MENNNIRTMEYIGMDDWDRMVFKCVETNILYKDLSNNEDRHELYSCGNSFDGEPNCPIKDDLQINYIGIPEQPTKAEKFNYMMLGRLRSDCDYYLGYGNRNAKNLWSGNEKDQIEKMKELYNSFSDDKKPEWITFEQILEYENNMIAA